MEGKGHLVVTINGRNSTHPIVLGVLCVNTIINVNKSVIIPSHLNPKVGQRQMSVYEHGTTAVQKPGKDCMFSVFPWTLSAVGNFLIYRKS
jgi:hypothetical protein